MNDEALNERAAAWLRDADGLLITHATPARDDEHVWPDASDEQLALGIATASEIFAARGVTAGYAAICSMAVRFYEGDPTLPEPEPAVRGAAAALREASDAALKAIGATHEREPEFNVHQGRAERLLWNELPTLREARVRTNSPYLAEPLLGYSDERA